jgi:hypothetical protein
MSWSFQARWYRLVLIIKYLIWRSLLPGMTFNNILEVIFDFPQWFSGRQLPVLVVPLLRLVDINLLLSFVSIKLLIYWCHGRLIQVGVYICAGIYNLLPLHVHLMCFLKIGAVWRRCRRLHRMRIFYQIWRIIESVVKLLYLLVLVVRRLVALGQAVAVTSILDLLSRELIFGKVSWVPRFLFFISHIAVIINIII